MSIEDEIRSGLRSGYTPQQLIQKGYKKSTVYKIHGNTRAQYIPVVEPSWSIQDADALSLRYSPGENIPLGFTFTNGSPFDIYVHRLGIRAEWMEEGSWLAQEVKELVKSGAQKWFNLNVTIPHDLAFGEYELYWGMEGQYLPSTQVQPIQVEWTDPTVIEVKRRLSGLRIFFSHSTKDLPLVRQLEANLDNAGIQVIIGENILQPGAILREKFESLIRESSLGLGLMTESGVESEWVRAEVNYALQIKKPCILLKEESVDLKTEPELEWTKFSRNSTPDVIFQKIMEAVSAVQETIPLQVNPIGAIIGVGILAFVVGMISSGSKK